MVAHVLSASVLVILTCYFCYFTKPEMEYFAAFLNDELPNLQVYAMPFGVLAALHIYAFAGGLVMTLTKQKVTFAETMWVACPLFRSCPGSTANAPSATHIIEPLGLLTWLRDQIGARIKIARRLLRLIFGIDSKHFMVFHMLREVIEVVTQIIQAYNASVLVSHSYINHLLVCVLILNCWSTPIIYHVMRMNDPQTRNELASARATCLLVGAFLNTVSCMGVPMALLVPFWRDFDWEVGDFPIQLLYNDVYYARIATESQMIATGTITGLLVRLVPHVGIWLCLSTVSGMVENNSGPSTTPHAEFFSKYRMICPTPEMETRYSCQLKRYRTNAAQLAFIGTGIAVLSIHVAAHALAFRSAPDPQCALVIAPWFATKYPCLVYTYDCQAFNDTTARDGILSFLDERTLLTLNFAHCSGLVVPTDIQRFPNLLGMNLRHLTLVDWPVEAALVPERFPSLTFLVFSYVNWTGIPAALLQPLPEKLGDIEMSHTNLSVIPDDLDQYWADVGSLVIEFCQIQHIPESLMRINLFDFSLIGNQLENVSVLAGLPEGIVRVQLDHNPLRVLPEAFDSADVALAVLGAEHTLIDDVSDALAASIDQMFLKGTPYCATKETSRLPVSALMDCETSFYRSDGVCQLT